MEKIKVSAEDDFLARQTRADCPTALAELIWNSLDADATRVSIEVENKDLAGGVSKIVINDNGHGFSREEAKTLFGNLGGSWKRTKRTTSSRKRAVHGKEGRGRYKSVSLGSYAEWKVCYKNKDGKKKFFSAVLNEKDLKNVSISDEKDAGNIPIGTIVEITNIKKEANNITSDSCHQQLSEIFALYLINYKDVDILLSGTKLDPQKAITSQTTIEITVPNGEDENISEQNATLEIIEWHRNTKRILYLCDTAGFPFSQADTRFHVGNFSFSAYIKSEYIEKLNTDNLLSGVEEMDSRLAEMIEICRKKIREHFRNRAAERARTVVDGWKEENLYPYKGEAQTVIETVERQVFDIVAVSVQDFAPDIASGSSTAKALHLRMLKQAIEKSPDDLQLILKEVLGLPQRKQQELANLLQETSLSSIITAAKEVADRLKFISALENLVFNKDTKAQLKERTQLHKIIAENTWIFGEEYNLWVSDKDLKRVLEKHKKHLDPNIAIDDPVKIDGKKRGIVDLMLSRAARRHRANDFEHLVVELKAPSVIIGDKELTQIKKYAFAVAGDERFKTTGVKWHFWVITNDYNDFTKDEIEGGPDRERHLIHKKGNISVGIRTWGDIIEENKARLQFFQEHLKHNVSEDDAIKFLQEKHKEFLEGVYKNLDDPPSANDDLAEEEDSTEEKDNKASKNKPLY